ncbi:MAG: FHA domain-containing protein [Verrucomicrobiota bacterium]
MSENNSSPPFSARKIQSFILGLILIATLPEGKGSEIDQNATGFKRIERNVLASVRFTGPTSIKKVMATAEQEGTDGKTIDGTFKKLGNGDLKSWILVILDNSNEQRTKAVEASKTLVESLIDSNQDQHRIALSTLGKEFTLLADYDASTEEKKEKLSGIKPEKATTFLFTRTLEGIENHLSNQGTGDDLKSILLLTDGYDQENEKDRAKREARRDRLTEVAKKEGIAISVAYYKEKYGKISYLENLKTLVKETNGKLKEYDKPGSNVDPKEFVSGLLKSLGAAGEASIELPEKTGGPWSVTFKLEDEKGKTHVLPTYETILPAALLAEGDDGTTEAGKPKDRKLVWILSGLGAAILAGGLIWFFTTRNRPEATPEADSNDWGWEPDQTEDTGPVGQTGPLPGLTEPGPGPGRKPKPEPKPSEPKPVDTPKPVGGLKPTSPSKALAWLEDMKDGKRYEIFSSTARLGRGKEADVRISNTSISSSHAVLRHKRGGSWTIFDLDSGNGIYINKTKTPKGPLAHGDIIQLGELELKFIEPKGENRK